MSESKPESPAQGQGRRRRWRVWAVAAVAAVALYALFGFFVVPRIVRSQIEKLSREMLHRQATVTRVRFNPFTLVAVVEGLDLADRDGSDLFHLDRLAADLQVAGIFRRAWRFREIIVDGPRAVARITADGRPSIADLFESTAGERPGGPQSSIPRLIIDRFALSGGRAELVDESRSPRFVEKFAPIGLELRDLATLPDESGGHSISLGFESGSQVRWSGRQTIEPLRFEGKVEITGIRLFRVWDYIAAANPLEIRDGLLDVTCSYDLRRASDGKLSMALGDVGVLVQHLALRPRSGGDDWLTIPLVEVKGARALWPESQVDVPELRVTGPHAVAWLAKDGTVNWQSALAGLVGDAGGGEPAPGAAAGGAAQSWSVKVGVFEILKATAHVEDRTFEPNVAVDVIDATLELENVTSDLKSPIAATFSARINGGGEANVSGTVIADPPAADLEIDVRGLELKPFNPYAIHLPWASIRRGIAGAKGKLHVGTGSPSIQFDGGLELADLQVAGGGVDRLLECKRGTASGAHVTVFPEKIHIAKVDLDGAFVTLHIDKEGNINVQQIVAADAIPATAPAPAPPSEPLYLDIGVTTIRNSAADYTDESLILPFGTRIHSINGSIKDLSTTASAAARLALEGRIAERGYFQSDGTLRIAAPFAASDVGVIFRGVNMPDLTPYAAQFAGYSIQKGTLDLDVRYRIRDGRLVGEHRVVAQDLTLGPKVEGAEGPGLPVRLAIALLKDKDGRIDLEVPIEGTIDSPEFNYRSIFWQAFKKIMGNVVKAPFRAIGRLFGADQEDLELVGFPSGRNDLPAPEQEKLAKLGAELAQKAEIALEIEGRYDPVADVEAIRRARLEERIEAKRAGAPNLEAILEMLFAETFSPERLEAERQKFMPGAPPAAPDEPAKKKRKQEPPPPPKEAFDAAGFYDALRGQLLTAEEVPESALADLARVRATAILTALTAPGGLDLSRVKVLDPTPVKRKKQGSELVASEMTLSAGD